MAIYTIRSGAPLHPEDTVLQHLTDMVRSGGVLDPETDLVTTQSSGGGLNVDVGQGRAYLKKDGNAYPVRNTLTTTVSINSNSSGNPRIDSIVLYLDLSVVPDSVNSQGDDVCFITAVEGTPAVSPTPPNQTQIETAIGANNPYLVLDNVYVASGATGISNSDITRVAKRVFMYTPQPIYTIDYASTITPDFSNGDQQEVTLTGDITVNEPLNMVVGDTILLKLIQDATGGRNVNWFAGITWLSADYSINTLADSVSVFGFRKTATNSYEGYLVGKEY